ncbi:hypothetical protein BGZ94_009585, partial [Podila epigama]
MASSSTASARNNDPGLYSSSSPKSSKHLSQPYNMQSISTDSLPTLFGAASLRRTNSNIVAKTRPSQSSSLAAQAMSTPASPNFGRRSSSSSSSNTTSTTSTTTSSPRPRPPQSTTPITASSSLSSSTAESVSYNDPQSVINHSNNDT